MQCIICGKKKNVQTRTSTVKRTHNTDFAFPHQVCYVHTLIQGPTEKQKHTLVAITDLDGCHAENITRVRLECLLHIVLELRNNDKTCLRLGK